MSPETEKLLTECVEALRAYDVTSHHLTALRRKRGKQARKTLAALVKRIESLEMDSAGFWQLLSRTPLAMARDEFLTHWRGARLCDPDPELWGRNARGYLMARVIKAWEAGAAWGQAHPFPRGGPPGPDQPPANPRLIAIRRGLPPRA